MRYLPDANILIALSTPDHTFHDRATAWLSHSGGLFATCPVTQGALIRFMLRARAGTTIHDAKAFLAQIASLQGHQFWPDTVTYLDLPETGVFGHKQVTDAYLVALARHHKGRLATLDRALVALHSSDTILIP